MDMPTRIKIGPQVFTVVERDGKGDATLHDGAYGYTLDGKNLIVLERSLPFTKKQVTLFHEIMHACRMTFENPTKPKKSSEFEEWEHYFVGIFESSLLMVLRDNPELVAWLLQEDS